MRALVILTNHARIFSMTLIFASSFQYLYFHKQCIFKQGHLDVELNDAGRQQAAAVSYHLHITCVGLH